MTSLQKNIFILDSDETVHQFIRQSLAPFDAGVYTFNSAEELLNQSANAIPDLIIMDLISQANEEITVCREIRNHNLFRHVLIAFYTSRNEDNKQIECLDAGADDFILKPCKSSVFLHRIQALLRRASPYRTTGQKDPGLVIDRDRYTVKKDQQEISLTRMEFELISFLLSSPKKAFSREEIYKNVWGGVMQDSNRTIDVHIRKLREKIGEDLISTIKGIGYRYS
jgi:two-component system alkaline phosphatase synthesis response regulator PhoP